MCVCCVYCERDFCRTRVHCIYILLISDHPIQLRLYPNFPKIQFLDIHSPWEKFWYYLHTLLCLCVMKLNSEYINFQTKALTDDKIYRYKRYLWIFHVEFVHRERRVFERKEYFQNGSDYCTQPRGALFSRRYYNVRRFIPPKC